LLIDEKYLNMLLTRTFYFYNNLINAIYLDNSFCNYAGVDVIAR